MPDTFEFTIPNPSLQLGADRTGSVVVDVTSRLGRHGVVGVEVQPGEGADASWFQPLEPAEFDLPDGETLRTTVPIAVPADAPPGDYQFGVRAYAIDNPQQDFTESPTISLGVPEKKEPNGIPWWIFVVLGVVVVLIIGLVLFFLFSGGDDEGSTPDVIGQTVPEARDEVGAEVGFAAFLDQGVAEADACVVLQTPISGTTATSISVLGVDCPEPAPTIATPEVLDTLCSVAFGFCNDIAESYGEDFATDEEWVIASDQMLADFVETFQIDGDQVAAVVGSPQNEAFSQLSDDGFDPRLIPDGTGGAQCVLFQHPYADDLAAEGDLIALVTTSCPGLAATPDQVVVDSTIDTNSFSNVCAIVSPFCTSVDSGPRGPGYTPTQDFRDDLGAMVVEFRNGFLGEVVPSVITLELGRAQSVLGDKGLSASTVVIPTAVFDDFFAVKSCFYVIEQSVPPGTLIDSLDSDVVTLFLQRDSCRVTTDINVKSVLEESTVADPNEFAPFLDD